MEWTKRAWTRLYINTLYHVRVYYSLVAIKYGLIIIPPPAAATAAAAAAAVAAAAAAASRVRVT